MGFATVAAVVSAVSFVYSIVKAQEARRRQKKMQQEANARADAAKGFQFTVEGETKSIPVVYGRAKIGGARVHHFLSNSYTIAPPSYTTTVSPISFITELKPGGAISVVGNTYRKVANTSDYDTAIRTSTTSSGFYVKFKLNQTSANIRLGATAVDNADLTATYKAAISEERKGFIGQAVMVTIAEADLACDMYATFKSDGTATIKSNTTKASSTDNITYTTADVFEYVVVNGVGVLLKNGIKWFTAQFTVSDLFFAIQFKGFNGELTILETGEVTTYGKIFRNRYRKKDVIGDCYLVMNAEDSYSGSWLNAITIPLAGGVTGQPQRVLDIANQIIPVDSDGTPADLIVLENDEGNEYKGRRWKVPKDGWVIVRGGDSFNEPVKSGSIYLGPKTDFIYIPFKKNGDGSYDTATKPNLAIEFPAPTQGTEDKLANSVRGKKHEYFYIQQAICHAGINDIIAVDVDDRPHSAAELKEGLRLHVYSQGGVADPLMYLVDPSRENAKFTGVSYLTGVFKLDRDDPQYSNTPEVKCYIEGMRVYDIEYANGVYSLSATKTYSNNPARCLLDYLLSKAYGKGLDIEEVDLESFYRAKLICDIIVEQDAILNGRYWKAKNLYTRDIPLYELNVTIDTAKPIRDNIETILEAMGLAELIWSDGKYKLSLNYPLLPEVGHTYQSGDTLQFYHDGKTRILRATQTTTALPTQLNTAAEGASNNVWADDHVVYVTDDDLVLDSETPVTINWADAQTRLNFATVRFLNEAKLFAEDSVSWPKKSSSVPYETAQLAATITANSLSNIVTFSSPVTLPVDTILVVNDKYLGKLSGAATNSVSATLTGLAMMTVTDAVCSHGIGPNLYMHYLIDKDNRVTLEGDFFESSITTYQHAIAKAEQRVRTTRDLVTYGFKLTLDKFEVEPNDFIHIRSEALGIDDLLLTAVEVSPQKGGIIEVSASSFDARMLAWNALDSEQPTYDSPYWSPIGQASGLAIADLPNSNLVTTAYKLSWTPADDNRVSQYLVRYTTDKIEKVSELDTVWTDLGTVAGNSFELPLLTGNFTFTVVSITADGKLAPFVDHENGSAWPMINDDIDSSHVLTDAVGLINNTSVKIEGNTVLKTQVGGYDVTVLTATLFNGVEEVTGDFSYRWSDITDTPVILNSAVSDYAIKFGYRSTESTATATEAELGQNVTNSVLFVDNKQLVISQRAVTSSAVILCEVKNNVTNVIYPGTVVLTDMSDPYIVFLESTGGTSLRNGLGTTQVFPIVYLGNDRITDLTGWQFKYSLFNENGMPGGFPAPERTAGYPVQINGNTAVVGNTFTLNLEVPITVSNGDLIKVFVNADAWYFKVQAAVNSLNVTCYGTIEYPVSVVPGADCFLNNELYICNGSGEDAGKITTSGGSAQLAAAITVDGNDIDRKARINVAVYTPF